MTENYSTFTTPDGFTIHTVHWLPPHEPKAVILLVHGVHEHSGRYTHVADALNTAGYAVYALDHRGHGRSSGQRGYFASLEQVVDDLEIYYRQIRASHPDKKIFVYGHSMGSLVSHMFLMRHQSEIAGWISSGTPIDLDTAVPGALLPILQVANRLIPQVALIPLGAEGVSQDPQEVQEYVEDPLNVVGRVRVRSVAELVTQGQKMRAALGDLRVPMLIMHGTADPITPPAGSRTMMERAASTDKTLKLYEGFYHEVHNEPEQQRVFNDMIAWLDAHL
ncbi:MAG: alpha/beta hydrolase [Anaerolineae bacterium]